MKTNADLISLEKFEMVLRGTPTHYMREYGDVMMNILNTIAYQERHGRNPFVDKTYTRDEISGLVEPLVNEMGLWQDSSCKDMKKALARLDPDDNGRVLLADIYAQPNLKDEADKLVASFAESEDNLREIGALDESELGKPKLLISNYLLGPANCYRMYSFYTYCCLSECDNLFSQIEDFFQSPTAPPEDLLALVSNMSELFDETGPVSDALASKLFKVASRHDGVVPLHGRLFAQWLHFAFPLECPYPHVIQTDQLGNAAAMSYYSSTIRNSTAMADQDVAEDENLVSSHWTDDELLPYVEFATEPSRNQRFGDICRMACVDLLRLGAIIAVLSVLKRVSDVLRSRIKSEDCVDSSTWVSSIDKMA
jgi:hypothetical protein